jgi:hypothetical protein
VRSRKADIKTPCVACPGALDSGPVEYELYGSIVHEGLRASTDSGHYVAYVRTADGAWWECNDNQARTARPAACFGCIISVSACRPLACMRLVRVQQHPGARPRSAARRLAALSSFREHAGP